MTFLEEFEWIFRALLADRVHALTHRCTVREYANDNDAGRAA